MSPPWHRNDMDAWGELFTKDCDFVTHSGLWWTGRDENVAEHKAVPDWVHAEKAKYDLRVAEIVPLADGVALVHAQWEWPGFTDPSAAGPIDRAGKHHDGDGQANRRALVDPRIAEHQTQLTADTFGKPDHHCSLCRATRDNVAELNRLGSTSATLSL